MDNLEVVFDRSDRAILSSYKSMLDGLADYLGPGCELVLHSLEDLDHSAVKVINGFHTGRTEGAPITELALSMLERLRRENSGDSIRYRTTNRSGAPLYSSTIAIRGSRQQVIGLLCINFYLDTPVSQLLSQVQAQGPGSLCTEHFVQDTREMIADAVSQAAAEVDAAGDVMPSERNRAIVERLYGRGIFSIKEAVALVAECLSISRNTVYLHLRHIRGAE